MIIESRLPARSSLPARLPLAPLHFTRQVHILGPDQPCQYWSRSGIDHGQLKNANTPGPPGGFWCVAAAAGKGSSSVQGRLQWIAAPPWSCAGGSRPFVSSSAHFL